MSVLKSNIKSVTAYFKDFDLNVLFVLIEILNRLSALEANDSYVLINSCNYYFFLRKDEEVALPINRLSNRFAKFALVIDFHHFIIYTFDYIYN